MNFKTWPAINEKKMLLLQQQKLCNICEEAHTLGWVKSLGVKFRLKNPPLEEIPDVRNKVLDIREEQKESDNAVCILA